MASESATASTAANDATVGTTAWTDVNNAKLPDNAYSFNTVDAGDGESNYLKLSSWSWATMLSSDTLTALTLGIDRKADTATVIHDSRLYAAINGTIGGSNMADVATTWPTTEGNKEYDVLALSGLGITCADLIDVDFAIFLAVQNAHPLNTADAFVDQMYLTATYTVGSSGTKQKVRSSKLIGKFYGKVG